MGEEVRKYSYLRVRVQAKYNQAQNSNINENGKQLSAGQTIFDRYQLDLHKPFPSLEWWAKFLNEGNLDEQELEQSISSSKYFRDDNTPDWIRLWHYTDLSDDEFEDLLKKVASQYKSRTFTNLGEIKHIFGLLLEFSRAGLFNKSKEDILKDSKDYIDHLKNKTPSSLISSSAIGATAYRSLGFNGRDLAEFQELSCYINKVRELAIEESLASAAQNLIKVMENDIWEFCKMIGLSSSEDNYLTVERYDELPIFKYIEPVIFVEKLLHINSQNRGVALWVFSKRYKNDNFNEKLIEELDWLKSVKHLLLERASSKKGKLSGHLIGVEIAFYLDKAIEMLEAEKNAIETSN